MHKISIQYPLKSLTSLSIALWLGVCSLATTTAHASGDSGCEDWCGEPTNAYFLRPANDTRANLALVLEDLHSLSLKPSTIPFHYFAFTDAPTADDTSLQVDADWVQVMELAARFGITADKLHAPMFSNSSEGRCVSNNPKAVMQFLSALTHGSAITAADKQLLAEQRLQLIGLCENAAQTIPQLTLASAEAQAFADYLHAAALFYGGQFDALLQAAEKPVTQTAKIPAAIPTESNWFERIIHAILDWFKRVFSTAHAETTPTQHPTATLLDLTASQNPWIKETAQYLLGRVYLNQAQKDFQFYSAEHKPDAALLAQAKTQFQTYLAAYPNGLYAQSARNLFRKIDWLAENDAGLTQVYAQQLASWRQQPPTAAAALEFFAEFDSKYPYDRAAATTAWESPLLASITALKAMRGDEYEADKPKPAVAFFQTAWESHQSDFAQADLTALHQYLGIAYQFYVAHDYAAVLQATQSIKPEPTPSNIAFSFQVLRGLALGQQGQWTQAESLWLQSLPTLQKTGQQIQLQWLLAMAWQQQNQLDKIYAADSPINQAEIQDYFLQFAAPGLLEKQLRNAKMTPATQILAYNTLLQKLLTHRNYAEFQRIAKQYPASGFPVVETIVPHTFGLVAIVEGYPCPTVDTLIAGLLKTPKAPNLLNCYADALNGLNLPTSAYPTWDDPVSNEHQLAGYFDAGQFKSDSNSDGFSGKTYTSLDLYIEVIDSTAKGEVKAYALSSATNCFARSGSNHCGAQEIPIEQRKAWFRELKSAHKDTQWAKQQAYYW